MALAHVHRFTTDEFLALGHLPERVELIDGIIHDMSPEGPLHAVPQGRIFGSLYVALPGHLVVAGGSIRCPDGFSPIPDVAVYRRGADEKPWFEISDAELAVEVGVSTRDRDRTVKADRYAEAGLPRLWLVAPDEGTLTVCSEPDGFSGMFAQRVALSWPDDLEMLVGEFVGELS
jgi:Uma2 family endonuclease